MPLRKIDWEEVRLNRSLLQDLLVDACVKQRCCDRDTAEEFARSLNSIDHSVPNKPGTGRWILRCIGKRRRYTIHECLDDFRDFKVRCCGLTSSAAFYGQLCSACIAESLQQQAEFNSQSDSPFQLLKQICSIQEESPLQASLGSTNSASSSSSSSSSTSSSSGDTSSAQISRDTSSDSEASSAERDSLRRSAPLEQTGASTSLRRQLSPRCQMRKKISSIPTRVLCLLLAQVTHAPLLSEQNQLRSVYGFVPAAAGPPYKDSTVCPSPVQS